MARSLLAETKDDINTDAGSILWSMIQGEQLEFPITLSFVTDVTGGGYAFEAVVIEANNVQDQTEPPTAVKSGGVQTVLTVRVPTNRGNWAAGTAYNKEEVVKYNNLYYKLLEGVSRINATTPDLDPYWQVTTLNKIYIQFPSTLGGTYATTATTTSNIYGFFELRVTEPSNAVFTNTWKPVRGLVEILFSPTHVVP